MVAMQNIVSHDQIPVAMAILVFSMNLGASCFLEFSLTVFAEGLKHNIPKYAPSVDPRLVIQAGATNFRNSITEDTIPGVLKAYAVSIYHIFYLLTGITALAFLFGWCMGWEDIRKNRPKPDENSTNA
jgi:hypothetical protein